MRAVEERACTILGEFERAQIELIGKGVVLSDGKAGTVESVWLDEIHGLRISIRGHEGNWPVSTIKRRQIRFTAGDGKFVPFKEPPLKAEFDEWLCRIACFAFSYPPTPFVDLSNRSVSETHERQGEEEGLDPLKL